jgi:hypothetical protein
MRQIAASGQVIDDLVLIAEAATAEEWKETIVFLPLKTKRDRTGLNDQTRKEGKSRATVIVNLRTAVFVTRTKHVLVRQLKDIQILHAFHFDSLPKNEHETRARFLPRSLEFSKRRNEIRPFLVQTRIVTARTEFRLNPQEITITSRRGR